MWRILKLKKVWIPLLVVITIGSLIGYAKSKQGQINYTTEMVKRQDLQQTVSATGTVKAAQEVDLNFKTSGRLSYIKVAVGDKVKAGTVVARLDSTDAQAAVLNAQANLKAAQANLAKLQAGAQPEDIAVTQASVAVAQTNLDNARQSLVNTKASQDRAVANALAQLVGLPVQPVASTTNTSTGTLTVTGTYQGTEQGRYVIRFVNRSNLAYTVSGLESGSYEGSTTTTTPIGTHGLLLQFSATGSFVSGDTWTIDIPNTASSYYASYKSTYDAALTTRQQQIDAAQAAVNTAEQALAQAKAQLNLKQAPARSYDILSAQSQVTSAQAALLQAQNNLNDRSLVAPVDGTITQVNNEVGETNSLTKPVVVMLSDTKNEIKVQVPESDIAKLQIGQSADITLDAFGSTEHFKSHITFIDPASTVIQDVVYYEVTVMFDTNDDRIKPGMTANLDINTANVKDVLVIPLRAVKYDNGRTYVEVLQKGQPVQKDVVVGLRGDDGLVEIKSGLEENEQVITFKSGI